MTVRRIVPNLSAGDPAALARFYRDLLGMDPLMEQAFIVTLGAGAGAAAVGTAAPQLSLARDGGSGQELPRISVEVDDLDLPLARARESGAVITYGPVQEPWGVRRFFLRDPEGHLVNILCHV
ncbi:glyoxalase [Thioclava sp. BHET1]|nr:glyoxalase [Thioclava sp. BHET1]